MSTAMLTLALALTASVSQPPAPSPAPPAEQVLAEKDRQIQLALDQTLADFTFHEVPLVQVLDQLADRLKIDIQANWNSLSDNGVDRYTPVSLRLHALPAARCLSAALDEARRDVQIGWEIRDGVLLVASRDWLDRELLTRLYPVEDLLTAEVKRLARVQAVPGGLEPRPHGAGDGDISPLVHAESRLMDLVIQSVEPDAWCENGGASSIRFFGGTAAVRASRNTHRQVERLLADLRAAGCAHPPIEKTRPRD